MEKEKLYKRSWFLWLMLIFIPPIGIILLWVNKKYSKVIRIILTVIFLIWLIIYAAIIDVSNDEPTTSNSDSSDKVTQEETTTQEPTTLSAEQQAILDAQQVEQDYQDWITSQFSLWDGSCKPLVKLVKDNMNDPKSFEHAETRYGDKGTGIGFDVYMKYRGKNAFGGVVTEEVTAFVDYVEQTVTITAQQ